MNLNKVDLYKQVAKKCKVTKNDVAKILKSTEEIVFDYLAHVEENEPRKVFIMNGLCAESKIIHPYQWWTYSRRPHYANCKNLKKI